MSINWYSFLSTIYSRKPWHQYVHLFEAESIFAVVKRVLDAATTVQQYGIEIDTNNIGELLKPGEGQTFEGQKILFPALHHKDTENLEEGELENSPAPSQADLDILSGDWLKKVSWKKEGEKEEEEGEDEEDDVNLLQYYDAKTSKSPPLGSSPEKKSLPLQSSPEKKVPSTYPLYPLAAAA